MKAPARLLFHIGSSSFASLLFLALPIALRAQGKTPLIDMRTTGAGENVSAEQLQNVPAGRDPWSVLSTAPGVQLEGSGRPSGSGGAVSGDNLFTIDGVRIGDQAALGGSGDYVNFDMIQETQVLKEGASAQYGADAVNGVINVVTKRGTNSWQGTGRFLGDDPYGLRSRPDPRILIEIMENMQDTGAGYCLNGVQVQAGGNPVPTGTDGPIDFGFDSPITIGVGAGSGAIFGAGASGNLNLAQIPGCAGQPYGLSFVDAPFPVTPPSPTHLYFGQNGVFAVDMGRIGMRYGFGDERTDTPYELEDTHIFNGNFYLTGMSSYVNGGFQLVPQTPGVQAASGRKQGFFVYGVDGTATGGAGQTGDILPKWDFYTIRLGNAPATLPDADGDGNGDSYFLSLGNLGSGCGGNVLGGSFTGQGAGSGGGALEAAADGPQPDCDYFRDWGLRGNDFSVNFGLRYELGGENRYVSPYESSDVEENNLSLGGTFGGSHENLGEPIIKDRLWLWGSYGIPDLEAAEEKEAALFSESFYQSRPNYSQLFQDRYYTPRSVQAAPGGRGVQGVGLELRLENGHAPSAPGGGTIDDPHGERGLQSLADELDSPLIYVVASGGPTGEVFQVQVVQPESGPVAIDGLVAVEPVAASAEDRAGFERELARAGGIRRTLTAAGYCLNQDLLAPPAGTVYRIAPADKQEAFAPMRRALDAARKLRDAGGLNPDSDPTDYYHSIRQWAVWSVEKGYDRAGFLDAFVERTEKNFRDAGQPWSQDVAAAVRSYGEGRWSDIREILDAAEAAP